jgi:hypothetical protein
MQIEPEEADTVRSIWGFKEQGMSARAIARALTAQRIPTPTGKAVWNPKTVNLIYSNASIYEGDDERYPPILDTGKPQRPAPSAPVRVQESTPSRDRDQDIAAATVPLQERIVELEQENQRLQQQLERRETQLNLAGDVQDLYHRTRAELGAAQDEVDHYRGIVHRTRDHVYGDAWKKATKPMLISIVEKVRKELLMH